MDASLYNEHHHNTRGESIVTEQQLGRVVGKLNAPGIQPAERRRLLLVAGTILIDHLRQMPGAIR